MIERNGGKVNVRLTTKTSYIICSTVTKEVIEKAKSHNVTLLNEHYILDSINARKRLPVASYLLVPQDVGGKKKRSHEESSNIYNFVGTPPKNTDKENHLKKIREKLKQISLKNKRDKEDVSEDKDQGVAPSKKLKLISITDCEEETIPPLKGLVFFVYGKFSIPANVLKNLILENGGSVACAVDDKVTHFLFGGENVDVPEFQEAQKLKIHIVNEYFLRLLIKY